MKNHVRERWPERPEPMDNIEVIALHVSDPTPFEIFVATAIIIFALVIAKIVQTLRKIRVFR